MGTLGQAVNLFKCCVFTWNIISVVLPAFLMAGALVVFVPSHSVMKYLGSKANRFLSYGVSAVSGNILTVCSCNVVPIFAGILRRGAGIGPAFCFLFAAPAIHIVNTIVTYKVIGFQLAAWRFITVPIIAVLVGIAMAIFFRKDERARQQQIHSDPAIALIDLDPARERLALGFMGLLVLVLVFGSWQSFDRFLPKGIGQFARIGIVLALILALVVLARRWFGREETTEWGRQTYMLLKMILPIFIPVVIVIAIIIGRIPVQWIMPTAASKGGFAFGHPEGNRILPVFLSAVFGTLMYFPILTEVVFVKGLLIKSFAVGPALAILLGGPGLSLPGLILIGKVAGWKKTAVYWATMVVLVTVAAYVFGSYYGDYLCPCQQMPKTA